MHARLLWARWILVTAALASAIGACPVAFAAEPETLETVLDVWRKREAAAESLKVVISEVRTASHATGLEGEAIGGMTKVQRTVILEGVNFRNEQEGEFADRGSEVSQQLLMIATNDGERHKAVTTVSRGNKIVRSNGWIHGADNRIDIRSLATSPVVRHWRALSPANDFFKLDKLKLVSTEERIGKVRCFLLQQAYGTLGGIEKVWVAPDQDMAILRRTYTQQERLVIQLDASFKSDAKLGWIPTSWATKSTRQDGSIGSTLNAYVVSTELNPEFPKQTFDIDWPQGTTVYDFVKRDKFYVPGTGKRK